MKHLAEVELLRRLGADDSRHVDCGGSGRSKPYGNAYLRNFVYQQPGSGHDKTAAQHEEVQAAADSAAPKFQKLVTESIQAFYRE